MCLPVSFSLSSEFLFQFRHRSLELQKLLVFRDVAGSNRGGGLELLWWEERQEGQKEVAEEAEAED
jgi:hypothetical protein